MGESLPVAELEAVGVEGDEAGRTKPSGLALLDEAGGGVCGAVNEETEATDARFDLV